MGISQPDDVRFRRRVALAGEKKKGNAIGESGSNYHAMKVAMR